MVIASRISQLMPKPLRDDVLVAVAAAGAARDAPVVGATGVGAIGVGCADPICACMDPIICVP